MTTTSKQAGEVRSALLSNKNRFVGLVSRIRELGLLVVLFLIVAIVSVQVPQFLTLGNIEQILLSISILDIIAVGETLVILTRNVDLSVGSVVGFSAYVAADLFKQHPGTSVILGILLPTGCATRYEQANRK